MMTRREIEAALPEGLQLPERCAIRLIELDPAVGGLIALERDGFVNIFLNARLPEAERLRALEHELRHYYRGDLESDEDIRSVERAVDGLAPPPSGLRAMDGTRLARPAPVFDPGQLIRVGRGIYLPTDDNAFKAAGDLLALRALLDEALGMFDVAQTPPLARTDRLRDLASRLSPGDVAFVGWRPEGQIDAPSLPVVLHFCRDDALHGALYYDRQGRVDNALAVLTLEDGHTFRVTVDFRRMRGRLAVCAIHREVDGGASRKVYG